MNLFLFGTSSKTIKNDCIFQQSSMAEDMGLEEVRSIQTLKFQGGKAPSTFVPGIVPRFAYYHAIMILYCYHLISNVFKPLLRSGHIAHHLFCSEVCAHLSTYKPGEFFRVSFPQHQFVQQSTLPTHFYLSLQTEICRFRFYSVLIAQNAAVFLLQRISTTNS